MNKNELQVRVQKAPLSTRIVLFREYLESQQNIQVCTGEENAQLDAMFNQIAYEVVGSILSNYDLFFGDVTNE